MSYPRAPCIRLMVDDPKTLSTPALDARHEPLPGRFYQVVLPDERHSQQTFEFLGFSPEGAGQRWRIEQLLMENPDTTPQSRLETHLDLLPDRIGLDYQGYFDHYKVGQELRDAIMDPEFADIRSTAGPGHWVRDSICGRVRILEESFMCRKGHLPSHEPVAPLIAPLASSSHLKDDVILYKGVSAWRTAHLISPSKPSRVCFDHLVAHEPKRCDFSRDRDGLYFTPQKELALKHASYANRRTFDISTSRLLTLRLPRDLLDLFSHRELWVEDPRDAWRKTVKLCQSSFFYDGSLRRPDRAPPNLASMLKQCDYLVGNVSKGHEGVPLQAPRGPNCHRLLTEKENVQDIRTADGGRERAVQWKFKKDVLDALEECIGVGGQGHLGVEVVLTVGIHLAGGAGRKQARFDSCVGKPELMDTEGDGEGLVEKCHGEDTVIT